MAQGTDELIGDLAGRAVAHAVFGDRRDFLKLVGTSTAAAALASRTSHGTRTSHA